MSESRKSSSDSDSSGTTDKKKKAKRKKEKKEKKKKTEKKEKKEKKRKNQGSALEVATTNADNQPLFDFQVKKLKLQQHQQFLLAQTKAEYELQQTVKAEPEQANVKKEAKPMSREVCSPKKI